MTLGTRFVMVREPEPRPTSATCAKCVEFSGEIGTRRGGFLGSREPHSFGAITMWICDVKEIESNQIKRNEADWHQMILP